MAQFGILPYVLRVVEITNKTYDDVLKMEAVEVFYLSTYIVKVEEIKEQQFKMQQAQLKARRNK